MPGQLPNNAPMLPRSPHGRRGPKTAVWAPLALTLSLVLAAPGAAQQAGQVGAVFREDLGRSYLRLERALAATHGLSEEVRSKVNRLFDRASMSLYGRWKSRAVELIDQAWLLVEAHSQPRASQPLAAAAALRAEPEPFLLRFDLDAKAPPRLRLRLLRPWTDDENAAVQLQLRLEAQGRTLLERPCLVRRDRVEPEVVSLQGIAPFSGRARALLVGQGLAEPVEIGVLQAAVRSLEQVRREALARLGAVEERAGEPAPALRTALTICRSRANLLSDEPSPDVTAHFLLDLAQLAEQVEQESQALVEGRNPYRLREGDLWLELPVQGAAMPARLYAPPQASRSEPVPLLIALHGAGGDESLFMEGYGAGRLRRLARKKGFVLLTPRTNPFLQGSRQALLNMVDAVATLYPIDRSRVYVMGHSLGAGVAATLARTASDVAAACVCFAGGGGWEGAGPMAPTKVYAGALDPIIPARGTLAAAQEAQQRGLPVEWEGLPAEGHTLFVGRKLEEAVNWLLQHRLRPQAQ